MNSKSGSKARSFKTISSEKKKKKTNQKTLGMAWGANSQSAYRSAIRNSPFADFGSYMAVKNQKLREQFDTAASSSSNNACSSGTPIFRGVTIFVDGYTVPSSQELKGYMLKYGGRFENYFSRHHVTHVICSNLPDSKNKNLRAFSGGLPVVKPEWIMESVTANKLLSWIPYQLATEKDNQPKVSAFFPLKADGASEATNFPGGAKVVPRINDQSMAMGISCPSEDSASSEKAGMFSLEVDDLMQVKSSQVRAVEPASSVESSCESKGDEISGCSPLDGENSDCESKPVLCHSFASFCNNDFGNCNSEEASSSKIILPSKQPHSTLSDPNFVENYFKRSRLHFIGTWRNRYRRRFPGSFSVSKSASLKMASMKEKTVIHIDMDCFFVSVVIRNRPEFLGKPVAVCHSDNPRGTAEISSANYLARDYGVKAGMFVKDAKNRCPHLVIVPYDFGAYEKVADQFYDILHNHCNKVQAVSCDEAFLDISELEMVEPQLTASIIRKEILESTGCTASAGIAGNMLMARLATKSAKPDGQCYIPPEEVDNYLCKLPVKVLPGIGHVLGTKLENKEIKTCGELRVITKESLQKDFGMKTGEMLWNYSRGIDNRMVGLIQESKSIGAEVNWGVRFKNTNDIQHFMRNLCKEVALRLQGCAVLGRSFTLKIKKKRNDAGEPVKYMGCGDCDNLSHTITIPMPTADVDVLQGLATQLLGHFQIDVEDIRGVGLQVSKLEGVDDDKPVHKRNSIRPWLFSTSARETGQDRIDVPPNHIDITGASTSSVAGSSGERLGGLASSGAGASQTLSLPPLKDLDLAVIGALPPDILSEINNMYDGKLLGLISAHTSKTSTIVSDVSPSTCKGELLNLLAICFRVLPWKYLPLFNIAVERVDCVQAHPVERDFVSAEIKNGEESPSTAREFASVSSLYLLPSSLSQVDCLVLQHPPEELRKDILKDLPLHTEPELVDFASTSAIDRIGGFASCELNDLWVGSTPKWVDKFELSSNTMLNNFANMYRPGSGGCFSTLLQRVISRIASIEVLSDGFADAAILMCELFKQYADLKIATDIEEIYWCMCLLRRLKGRSEFFSRVYDNILPHLQALVAEKYGGTLNIT